MYTLVVLAHSWLRWLVLLLGVALLAASLRAWRADGEWSERGDVLRKGFFVALDLQVLLGLSLYLVLSPISRSALADLGAALGASIPRFYSVEHPFGMMLGVAVAHAAAIRARRREGPLRYRTLFIGLALWLAFTLGSVPWPGLPYGRPLLRF